MQGTELATQAQTKFGQEAEALFQIAREKYQTALQIKPDKHEALNNLGNVLVA
jgi:Tfp pilus assembly protein PilF